MFKCVVFNRHREPQNISKGSELFQRDYPKMNKPQICKGSCFTRPPLPRGDPTQRGGCSTLGHFVENPSPIPQVTSSLGKK